MWKHLNLQVSIDEDLSIEGLNKLINENKIPEFVLDNDSIKKYLKNMNSATSSAETVQRYFRQDKDPNKSFNDFEKCKENHLEEESMKEEDSKTNIIKKNENVIIASQEEFAFPEKLQRRHPTLNMELVSEPMLDYETSFQFNSIRSPSLFDFPESKGSRCNFFNSSFELISPISEFITTKKSLFDL